MDVSPSNGTYNDFNSVIMKCSLLGTKLKFSSLNLSTQHMLEVEICRKVYKLILVIPKLAYLTCTTPGKACNLFP